MFSFTYMRWALLLCGALALVSCHKMSAAEVIGKESTIAERTEQATFYWNITGGGAARLVVKDGAGSVVKEGVTGQLNFADDGKADGTSVELSQDTKSGVLSAAGPKLDGEVTQVKYAVLVDGKPSTGALHVPPSGTDGLAKAAKENAGVEEEKGPNGGTVQVVNDQRYEVVADAGSGEVRVYVLGADAKRPKKIRLGVDSKNARVVELKPHEEGYYVVALASGEAPRKLTLFVVDDDDKAHALVIGHRADNLILVDAHPKFWVRRGWQNGLARGHHKGTSAGPPGQAKVQVKSKGNGKFSVKGK
jgi:hypothetical protein